MKTSTGLVLLIGLYFLFSAILWHIFPTGLIFFVSAFAAAIVGLVISLVVKDIKAS